MRRARENRFGVSEEAENAVMSGKSFILILPKGKIVYERTFTPIGGLSDTGIQMFKHEKNTYEIIQTPSGEVHRLTDKKPMSSLSTMNNGIYDVLRTLENSGYKFVNTGNWKVI